MYGAFAWAGGWVGHTAWGKVLGNTNL